VVMYKLALRLKLPLQYLLPIVSIHPRKSSPAPPFASLSDTKRRLRRVPSTLLLEVDLESGYAHQLMTRRLLLIKLSEHAPAHQCRLSALPTACIAKKEAESSLIQRRRNIEVDFQGRRL
jgi:hypothetical protein